MRPHAMQYAQTYSSFLLLSTGQVTPRIQAWEWRHILTSASSHVLTIDSCQLECRLSDRVLDSYWVFRDVVFQDVGFQNTTIKTPRPCQFEV